MQKVRVKLISSFNGVLLLPILLKLAVQAIVFVFNSRKNFNNARQELHRLSDIR